MFSSGRSGTLCNCIMLVVTLLAVGVAISVSAILSSTATRLAIYAGVASIALMGGALMFPELPVVILIAGMPIWGLAPTAITQQFEGLRLPLTLGLCIVFFGTRAVLHGRLRFTLPRLMWEDILLIAFTLWVGVAIGWSHCRSYGVFKLLAFAVNGLGIYAVIRYAIHLGLFNLRRFALLLTIAGMTHVAVLAYCNAQIGIWSIGSALGDAGRTSYLRGMGLNKIAESNSLALAVLATSWLWYITRRKILSRAVLAAALALQLWALLSYQQRGPQLGLLGSLSFLWLVLYRPSWRLFQKGWYGQVFLLGVGLVAVLGGVLYALNPSFGAAVLPEDKNIRARLEFYELGWRTFLSHPVTGIGTGGMATDTEDIFQRFYVHNLLIEVSAETGVVGAILLLAFSGQLLLRTLATLRRFDSCSRLSLALAASGFLHLYLVAMFSSDLHLWQMGVWAALVVESYRKGVRKPRSGTVQTSGSAVSRPSGYESSVCH